MKFRYIFDKDYVIGDVKDTVWSSFTEHLGRSIYEGIYDPGKPWSDEKGFRKDVKNIVRNLNLGVVRYPGGNFVSNYNWKDGIGPKKSRPKPTSSESMTFVNGAKRLAWNR